VSRMSCTRAGQRKGAPGIGGRTLAFDQIFNEAFFTPSKIKELRETYNAPYPQLVFEGFSPILLELMYSEFDSIKWNDWKRTTI
jgi:hypothetical protein